MLIDNFEFHKTNFGRRGSFNLHFNYDSSVQPRGESPNGIRSCEDFWSEAEDLPDSKCGVAPRFVGKGLLRVIPWHWEYRCH